MLFIIIVVLISVFVFIIYKSYFEKKIKLDWLKIAIEALIIFMFIPLCLYSITAYIQDIKDQRVQSKNEKFQKILLNSIYSDSINLDQLNELIELKHKDIFQSSTEEAEIFTKNLLADIEKKRKGLVELSDNSAAMIKKLYLKWKPFFDFVLATFDDRVDELLKHDNRIEYIKNSGNPKLINPIIYDADLKQYGRTSLRNFTLRSEKGVTGFNINYNPGQVREGLCIKELVMTISEGRYQAFQFHFTEDGIRLDPDYKRYKMRVNSNMNDPLEDVELREKTIETINLLISSIYIR